MADQTNRPEVAEAIQGYKFQLARAKGQEFSDNTSVEYSRGWFAVISSDGTSFKCRLAQIETITKELRRGEDLKNIGSLVPKKKRKPTHSSGGLWSSLTANAESLLDWMGSHLLWVGLGFPILIIAVLSFLDPKAFDSPRQKVAGESTPDFCIWPGCTNRPSEFWADKTGYCKEHIQKALERQKLEEKVRKQGY